MGFGGELDGEVSWTSDLATGPRHCVGVCEFELGDHLKELADGDLHLHTGQVGTCASVRSGSEGDMAVLLAVDDYLVGVLEHGRVAVRGRERQNDPLAFADRALVDGGVVSGESGHGDG